MRIQDLYCFLMQREGLFQWEAGLAGPLEFLEGISSVVCVGVVINMLNFEL